ncbi:MAG: hypothetical protein KF682_21055, partial [Nitrospira sp.]|nr:hypothetical protein [Nitrospira sp.]
LTTDQKVTGSSPVGRTIPRQLDPSSINSDRGDETDTSSAFFPSHDLLTTLDLSYLVLSDTPR